MQHGTSQMRCSFRMLLFLVVIALLCNLSALYWLSSPNRCTREEIDGGAHLTIFFSSCMTDQDNGEIGTGKLKHDEVNEFLAWKQQKVESSNLSPIFMITPTYARWTQKADLTRLCQTLMHVPSLHWIVVEDSEEKTDLVKRLLERCTIDSTHLNIRTGANLQLKDTDPRWLRHRGVEQRNLAIDHLRKQYLHGDQRGVVYFGDDDNTYDLQVFEEMRSTHRVSVWPVGLSGDLKFEGPVCAGGRVTGWYTMWEKQRPFPIDMAGFAVNLSFLLSHPKARIDPSVQRGYLESSLLSQLVTMEQLEPKANMCTQVLVWHTRTEKPKMKWEESLLKQGKPSNPNIEV